MRSLANGLSTFAETMKLFIVLAKPNQGLEFCLGELKGIRLYIGRADCNRVSKENGSFLSQIQGCKFSFAIFTHGGLP
jgi:hypothetical protein